MSDLTPTQNAYAWLSQDCYLKAESMLRSYSGADQSESEAYMEESRLYQSLIRGISLFDAIQQSRRRFHQYVRETNSRVESAAKIESGPRAGQSVISHQWVDLDQFDRLVPAILFKVEKALSDPDLIRERKGRISGRIESYAEYIPKIEEPKPEPKPTNTSYDDLLSAFED